MPTWVIVLLAIFIAGAIVWNNPRLRRGPVILTIVVLGMTIVAALMVLTAVSDVLVLLVTAYVPTSPARNWLWFAYPDPYMQIISIAERLAVGAGIMLLSRVFAPIADKPAFREAFATVTGGDAEWAVSAWTTVNMATAGVAAIFLIITGFYASVVLNGSMLVWTGIGALLACMVLIVWGDALNKLFRLNHEDGNTALDRLRIALLQPSTRLLMGVAAAAILLMVVAGIMASSGKTQAEETRAAVAQANTMPAVAQAQAAPRSSGPAVQTEEKHWSETSCPDQVALLKSTAYEWSNGRSNNPARMCRKTGNQGVLQLCASVEACQRTSAR